MELETWQNNYRIYDRELLEKTFYNRQRMGSNPNQKNKKFRIVQL